MNSLAMTSQPGRHERHSDNPKNVVNSVAKAFAVLQAFSSARPALTISELALAAGLDRGTAFRLVHTLVGLGYLREADARKLRLTVKCMELGFLALSSQPMWADAQPLLAECVPAFCNAASLGTLEGADVVYMARVEHELVHYSINRQAGHRVRAYGAALGHCILAFLPESRQIEVLESAERVKLSERTLIDLDALLERLRMVKEQGYAISDGENAYGFRTIAVPVFGIDGQPVAGVSLTVNAQRMSIEEFIRTATPKALSVASELQRAVHVREGATAVRKTSKARPQP